MAAPRRGNGLYRHLVTVGVTVGGYLVGRFSKGIGRQLSGASSTQDLSEQMDIARPSPPVAATLLHDQCGIHAPFEAPQCLPSHPPTTSPISPTAEMSTVINQDGWAWTDFEDQRSALLLPLTKLAIWLFEFFFVSRQFQHCLKVTRGNPIFQLATSFSEQAVTHLDAQQGANGTYLLIYIALETLFTFLWAWTILIPVGIRDQNSARVADLLEQVADLQFRAAEQSAAWSREIELRDKQIANLEARIERAESEKADAVYAQHEALEEAAYADCELVRDRLRYARHGTNMNFLRAEVKRLGPLVDAAKKKLKDCNDEIARAKNEHACVSKEVDDMKTQLHHAQVEDDSHKTATANSESALKSVDAKLRQAEKRIKSQDKQIEKQKRALHTKTTAFNSEREKARNLKRCEKDLHNTYSIKLELARTEERESLLDGLEDFFDLTPGHRQYFINSGEIHHTQKWKDFRLVEGKNAPAVKDLVWTNAYKLKFVSMASYDGVQEVFRMNETKDTPSNPARTSLDPAYERSTMNTGPNNDVRRVSAGNGISASIPATNAQRSETQEPLSPVPTTSGKDSASNKGLDKPIASHSTPKLLWSPGDNGAAIDMDFNKSIRGLGKTEASEFVFGGFQSGGENLENAPAQASGQTRPSLFADRLNETNSTRSSNDRLNRSQANSRRNRRVMKQAPTGSGGGFKIPDQDFSKQEPPKQEPPKQEFPTQQEEDTSDPTQQSGSRKRSRVGGSAFLESNRATTNEKSAEDQPEPVQEPPSSTSEPDSKDSTPAVGSDAEKCDASEDVEADEEDEDEDEDDENEENKGDHGDHDDSDDDDDDDGPEGGSGAAAPQEGPDEDHEQPPADDDGATGGSHDRNGDADNTVGSSTLTSGVLVSRQVQNHAMSKVESPGFVFGQSQPGEGNVRATSTNAPGPTSISQSFDTSQNAQSVSSSKGPEAHQQSSIDFDFLSEEFKEFTNGAKLSRRVNPKAWDDDALESTEWFDTKKFPIPREKCTPKNIQPPANEAPEANASSSSTTTDPTSAQQTPVTNGAGPVSATPPPNPPNANITTNQAPATNTNPSQAGPNPSPNGTRATAPGHAQRPMSKSMRARMLKRNRQANHAIRNPGEASTMSTHPNPQTNAEKEHNKAVNHMKAVANQRNQG